MSTEAEKKAKSGQQAGTGAGQAAAASSPDSGQAQPSGADSAHRASGKSKNGKRAKGSKRSKKGKKARGKADNGTVSAQSEPRPEQGRTDSEEAKPAVESAAEESNAGGADEGNSAEEASKEASVADEQGRTDGGQGSVGDRGARGRRRTHERKILSTTISLHSDSNLYTGLTNNLSEGGVFVATHHLLPIGATVHVELSFADVGGPDIHAKGEVRWVREESADSGLPPGMGIRFVELEHEHRKWIEGFCSTRDPLFHDDDEQKTTELSGADLARSRRWTENILLLTKPSKPGRALVMVAGALSIVMIIGLIVTSFVGGDDPPASRKQPVQAVQASPADATPSPHSAQATASSGQADGGLSTDARGALEAATVEAGTARHASSAGDSAPSDGAEHSAQAAAAAVDSAGVVADSGSAATPAAPDAGLAPKSTHASAAAPAGPPHVAAGRMVAQTLRQCGVSPQTRPLRVGVYMMESGKIIRAFISPKAAISAKQFKCTRAAVRGLQTPLTLPEKGFAEWRIRLLAGGGEDLRLVGPAALKRRLGL